MKAFQYLIIFNPTEKQKKDDGLKSEIVGELTTILAADESKASILAARNIPEKYLNSLEQIEIAIRPF